MILTLFYLLCFALLFFVFFPLSMGLGKKGDGKGALVITTKTPSKQRSGSKERPSSSIRNQSPELPAPENHKVKSASSSVAVTKTPVPADDQENRVSGSTNKKQRKSGTTATRGWSSRERRRRLFPRRRRCTI